MPARTVEFALVVFARRVCLHVPGGVFYFDIFGFCAVFSGEPHLMAGDPSVCALFPLRFCPVLEPCIFTVVTSALVNLRPAYAGRTLLSILLWARFVRFYASLPSLLFFAWCVGRSESLSVAPWARSFAPVLFACSLHPRYFPIQFVSFLTLSDSTGFLHRWLCLVVDLGLMALGARGRMWPRCCSGFSTEGPTLPSCRILLGVQAL